VAFPGMYEHAHAPAYLPPSTSTRQRLSQHPRGEIAASCIEPRLAPHSLLRVCSRPGKCPEHGGSSLVGRANPSKFLVQFDRNSDRSG